MTMTMTTLPPILSQLLEDPQTRKLLMLCCAYLVLWVFMSLAQKLAFVFKHLFILVLALYVTTWIETLASLHQLCETRFAFAFSWLCQ